MFDQIKKTSLLVIFSPILFLWVTNLHSQTSLADLLEKQKREESNQFSPKSYINKRPEGSGETLNIANKIFDAYQKTRTDNNNWITFSGCNLIEETASSIIKTDMKNGKIKIHSNDYGTWVNYKLYCQNKEKCSIYKKSDSSESPWDGPSAFAVFKTENIYKSMFSEINKIVERCGATQVNVTHGTPKNNTVYTIKTAPPRSGDYAVNPGSPKNEGRYLSHSARCLEGGYAWVNVQHDNQSVYAYGGGGFEGAVGWSTTQGLDYAMRMACRGEKSDR